jgi:hypothetical protein
MAVTFPRTDIMSFCAYSPDAAPLKLVSRQQRDMERNVTGIMAKYRANTPGSGR